MGHQHDGVLGFAAVILIASGVGFLAGAWDLRRRALAAGRWRSVLDPIADPTLRPRSATDAAAATLLLAVAAIHLVAAATHGEESHLFAVAFAATAGIQVTSGVGVLLGKPLAYRLAIWTSVVVVVSWTVSRLIGLPVGPHPWIPEPIGLGDGMATTFEVMVIVLLGVMTRSGTDAPEARRSVVASDLGSIGIVPFVGIVGLLAAIAVTSSAAGGSHHHDDIARNPSAQHWTTAPTTLA
jgi:hypothetical protein